MSNERLELQCKWLNETVGKRNLYDGYNCEKCKNKGQIYYIRGQEVVARLCSCISTRKNIALVNKSGLKELLEKKRFDNFLETENWQRSIKERAKLFIDNGEYKTFFIGGQCGSGKTHVCVAMCGELLKKGAPTLYMLWTRDARALKAVSMEREFYEKIQEYINVRVLYIDDFLKVMKGTSPTSADMNIAFEILNARLNDPEKITLISSEFTIDELLKIDEGTASRICENAGSFVINIGKCVEKNHRMKG